MFNSIIITWVAGFKTNSRTSETKYFMNLLQHK